MPTIPSQEPGSPVARERRPTGFRPPSGLRREHRVHDHGRSFTLDIPLVEARPACSG